LKYSERFKRLTCFDEYIKFERPSYITYWPSERVNNLLKWKLKNSTQKLVKKSINKTNKPKKKVKKKSSVSSSRQEKEDDATQTMTIFGSNGSLNGSLNVLNNFEFVDWNSAITNNADLQDWNIVDNLHKINLKCSKSRRSKLVKKLKLTF